MEPKASEFISAGVLAVVLLVGVLLLVMASLPA
jgi:hypothetical protein